MPLLTPKRITIFSIFLLGFVKDARLKRCTHIREAVTLLIGICAEAFNIFYTQCVFQKSRIGK